LNFVDEPKKTTLILLRQELK